jgi:hypothetical protein
MPDYTLRVLFPCASTPGRCQIVKGGEDAALMLIDQPIMIYELRRIDS